MPLFEYNCAKCDHQFTELRKSSDRDEPLACPSCKASDSKRVVSGFAVSGGGTSSGGGGYSPPPPRFS